MAIFNSTQSWYGGYYLQAKVVVNQGIQSIPNNNTAISGYVEIIGSATYQMYSGNGINVYIDGQLALSTGSRTFRRGDRFNLNTVYVGHNRDGTKTVNITVSGRIFQNISGASSMALTTIPRFSSILSSPNFNDEENPKITFTNPSRYYKIQAKMEVGGDVAFITRNLSSDATSCTFELTETERNRLRIACKGKTLPVRFTVCSMNNDYSEVLSASWLDRTMTIVNANPRFTGYLEYTETKNTLGYNKVLQGFNNIKITARGEVIGEKFANIETLQLKINNQIYNNDPSNLDFEIGTLNLSGNVRGELTAIDSRGFSSSPKTIDIYVYEYTPPTIEITAKRRNNFENETAIDIKGRIEPIVIYDTLKNSILTLKYSFKNEGSGSVTSFNLSASVNKNGEFKVPTIYKNLPNDSRYIFTAEVIDKYNERAIATTNTDKGKGIFLINTSDGYLYNNDKKIVTEDRLNDMQKIVDKMGNSKKIYNIDKRIFANGTLNTDLYSMPDLTEYLNDKYLLHIVLSYANSDGSSVKTIFLSSKHSGYYFDYIRDVNANYKDILFFAVQVNNLNSRIWNFKKLSEKVIDSNNNIVQSSYGNLHINKVIIEQIKFD